jgi:hypothetical protein
MHALRVLPCSPEVAVLLRAVPEFRDRYLALVEAADDDPGPAQAFGELAEFVSELADRLVGLHPVLTRCLEAVEQVAATSDDAEELVGWSFLDYLSIEARRCILAWLGPRTREILESVEDPS